jgi:hypothetical protein
MKPPQKRTAWILAALCAAVALLLALTLHGVQVTHDRAARDGKEATAPPSPTSRARRVVVPSTLADETPPWEVKPTAAASLPPGTVPAWKVDPPRPEPRTPPEPREPPNPAVHRPPIFQAAP